METHTINFIPNQVAKEKQFKSFESYYNQFAGYGTPQNMPTGHADTCLLEGKRFVVNVDLQSKLQGLGSIEYSSEQQYWQGMDAELANEQKPVVAFYPADAFNRGPTPAPFTKSLETLPRNTIRPWSER